MQPGEQIEQYILIEQIGQGGQAAVWSAEDNVLRRTVAIKTINLTTPVQPNTMASSAPSGSLPGIEEQAIRFRNEAKIIADLEHPYILPIYSFGQRGDWLYIVMRYMPGGTLRKRVDDKGLPLSDTIKIAASLADALDEAHHKQIIHRDIKSVNVLLDAQSRPYLADFGLSVTAGDPNNSKSGSGTLAYMAPEQISGGEFDYRSDLYSFGLLLYEMLTGSLPQTGAGHWNLAQMMHNAPLPDAPSLSGAVMAVLQRSTARNPDDRYTSAAEMVEALRTADSAPDPTNTIMSVDDALFLQPLDTLIGDDPGDMQYDGGMILIELDESDPAAQAKKDADRLLNEALIRWSDGAGRFRFYEEDFRFVEGYFNGPSGSTFGSELDDAEKRLMLRAALENDFHVDYWWGSVLTEADRRAVALQTLTSELPLARLRALEKLSAIPDSTPPAIPTRTAAIIAAEPEPSVRLAGIKLLSARGTALTPVSKAGAWREVAFSPNVDAVIGRLARDPDPQVRHEAALTIARLKSTAAVNAILDSADKRGSVKAESPLITIRDQAGSLPSTVPTGMRQRVFTALTFRQLFGQSVVGQYLAALFGFGVGWAILQVINFNQVTGAGNVASGQAIGNAAASAALYGALVAIALALAIIPAERLRAWNVVVRTALSWILGTGAAMFAFLAIRNYYYFASDPMMSSEWPLLLAVCALFVGGFALGSGIGFIRDRVWLRSILGGIGAFAALWYSHQLYVNVETNYPLLVAFAEDSALNLIVVMAVSLGLLTYLPAWSRAIRQAFNRLAGIS